tara:strand:- start:275 stop:475 length:201 start_codon:yes stop_codon:yes gene_type:complete
MKQKTHLKYADIITITGISERTFRYRMADLKIKYKNSPDLLFKKGHSWRIHVSLINEFNNKHTNKN